MCAHTVVRVLLSWPSLYMCRGRSATRAGGRTSQDLSFVPQPPGKTVHKEDRESMKCQVLDAQVCLGGASHGLEETMGAKHGSLILLSSFSFLFWM